MLHDGILACSILFISRSYESSHDCFNGIKVEVHTLIKRLPKVAKIICLYATYPFFFFLYLVFVSHGTFVDDVVFGLGRLPTAGGKLLLGLHAVTVDTDHGLTETGAGLSNNLGILEVSGGLDNSLGALGWVARLEDAAADKDTVATELHHEGSVSGGSNTASGEVDNGQATELGSLAQKLSVDLELAGHFTDADDAPLGESSLGLSNLLVDRLHVANGLDDIASPGFTLGPDHGSALGNAAQGLAQIAAATDKGRVEVALLNVALVIGGGQNFTLVNVVDAESLEDLALNKVADAGLGHDGNGDGGLDLLDDSRVRHAGNAAVLSDIGGDTLEGHDGASTGFLSDTGLRGVGHVHDDTALEHLSETGLDGKGGLGSSAIGSGGGSFVGHCDGR